MQPARGEPGRNGYHRPLESFDLIVAVAANYAPGPFRRRDPPRPAMAPLLSSRGQNKLITAPRDGHFRRPRLALTVGEPYPTNWRARSLCYALGIRNEARG